MAGLVLSGIAYAVSPLLMPDSYSWIAHTLSQAAAQGQEGGWLSRLGFLLAGLTILRLSSPDVVDWMPLARQCHRVTGVLVLAAIAFTDRSWDATAPYDRVENIVHSTIATSIALSFTVGVLLVLYEKRVLTGRVSLLESVVVAVEIAMPPMMLVWVEGTGLIERVMFGAGFFWYGWEVLRCARLVGTGEPSPKVAEPSATRFLDLGLRRFLRLPPQGRVH
jgi:hypothetical protein